MVQSTRQASNSVGSNFSKIIRDSSPKRDRPICLEPSRTLHRFHRIEFQRSRARLSPWRLQLEIKGRTKRYAWQRQSGKLIFACWESVPGDSLNSPVARLVPFASAFHPLPPKPFPKTYASQRTALLDFHQATGAFCERAASRRRFLVARERRKEKKEKNNSTREIRSRPATNFPLSFCRFLLEEEEVGEIGVYKDTARIGVEYHRRLRRGNQDMKEREMTDKKVGRGTRDGGRTSCYEGKSSGRTQSRNSWEPISSDENTSLKASTVFQPGQFLFVAPFFSFFFFCLFFFFENIACNQPNRESRASFTVLLHLPKVLRKLEISLVIRHLDSVTEKTQCRWSRSNVLLDSRVSIGRYLLTSPKYYTTIDSLSRRKWLLP